MKGKNRKNENVEEKTNKEENTTESRKNEREK